MANHTERIGLNHCGEIAELNHWMFREQPTNDAYHFAYISHVEADAPPVFIRYA